MKRCVICNQEKDESEFSARRRNQDGSISLRSECKSCRSMNEMERYYIKQEFSDSKKTPCAKCGESRIRCLCFHHINPAEKDFTIGQLRKTNLENIEHEIQKCMCLCLNCHHEFHYLNNANGMSLDNYLSG